MSDAVSTDRGFDSATDSVTERIGVNPSDAFAGASIERPAVEYREVAGGSFDGNGTFDGGTGGSYSFGADDSLSGDGERFERNLDGSIKRNRDGSPRRKRGRAPGYKRSGDSGTRSSGKEQSADVLTSSAISSVLIMVAGTAAAMTNHEHWATDEAEVKPLAEATVELEKHYNIPLTGKQIALFNFTLAAGMFIAPRVVLSAQKIKAERASKAKKPGANVPAKTQTPQPPATPSAGPIVPAPLEVSPVMRNPGFEG